MGWQFWKPVAELIAPAPAIIARILQNKQEKRPIARRSCACDLAVHNRFANRTPKPGRATEAVAAVMRDAVRRAISTG
jgi:hypothetical protein